MSKRGPDPSGPGPLLCACRASVYTVSRPGVRDNRIKQEQVSSGQFQQQDLEAGLLASRQRVEGLLGAGGQFVAIERPARHLLGAPGRCSSPRCRISSSVRPASSGWSWVCTNQPGRTRAPSRALPVWATGATVTLCAGRCSSSGSLPAVVVGGLLLVHQQQGLELGVLLIPTAAQLVQTSKPIRARLLVAANEPPWIHAVFPAPPSSTVMMRSTARASSSRSWETQQHGLG